ncbi:tryptophan--tRNA ligase, mitochondrial [Amyelois transitella]|uniref:tryptophan--tRNA ligase, mitochondrial n=1 Tax=Amyelois transitella TaxID=680683 RepID=UPI00067C6AE8|nr:tryptophan--tRNA ligase, mitochondrial [Amyelois transitella]
MEIIRRSLYNCRRCSHSVGSIGLRCKYSVKKELDDDGPFPRRVVAGLQPTGALHIGNYFGALQRCVELQDKGDDLMIFIADLHALTTYQEPAALQENILDLTASMLAAGVQPARSVLWAQSAVPRHAELCWLLACLATHARLAHLPQYKERVEAHKEVGMGLLLYPVLQAADVLLYRARRVCVGADQLQHLQVAAQLVRTFHHRYRRVFPVPRALLPDDGSQRLRSLRDPTKKMSKSDPDPKSRILLTDPDDVITLKIRKAVTDCNPQVTYAPEERPGVSNLVQLYCLAAARLPEEAVEEAAGLSTAQFKLEVARALCDKLRPVRERFLELRARPDMLRDVLRAGAATARLRADDTFGLVREALGLAATAPDKHTKVLLKN